MSETPSETVARKMRQSSRFMLSTMRRVFVRDFSLVIMWAFVFFACTPSTHVVGGLFILAAPVFFTMYRTGVLAPVILMRGAAVNRLRPDRMYKAPTRFRTLAYMSHHAFLYRWSIAGFISAFIVHSASALFLVLYTGVRSHSAGVVRFFMVYAVAIVIGALQTYWSTIYMYDVGVNENVLLHLKDSNAEVVYAAIVADTQVRKTERRMNAEIERCRERERRANKKFAERSIEMREQRRLEKEQQSARNKAEAIISDALRMPAIKSARTD